MNNNDIIFEGKTEAIYKIIVIGDPAVGKTELIAKFASNQFEEKYLKCQERDLNPRYPDLQFHLYR